jgi:hypothetical protein
VFHAINHFILKYFFFQDSLPPLESPFGARTTRLPKEKWRPASLKKQQRKLAALLAVFPTRESFLKFSSDKGNAPIVQAFIDYAQENDLISEGNVSNLEALISRHERPQEDCTPPAHLSFKTLLDSKEQWLKIRLSASPWPSASTPCWRTTVSPFPG